MIAAVHFRNFKALRSTTLNLAPFNLVLGPNGSGKTSLIQAMLRLRTLAGLPTASAEELSGKESKGPEIVFQFTPPYNNLQVRLGCHADELVCNLLAVDRPDGAEGKALWESLRGRLRSIRAFLLDHYAMAEPCQVTENAELGSNGRHLAGVLHGWKQTHPEALAALQTEFIRLMPEFSGLELTADNQGTVVIGARLREKGGDLITGENLSQGTLYQLAILAIAFSPSPPAVVCLEEADRGMHPRSLREVRDTLYRLSYPEASGMHRTPVQVIATTHSPYLLDQFRDHPEEVVLASKQGMTATFERLSDRADILAMMEGAHLGDLWYSGILGGVPGE